MDRVLRVAIPALARRFLSRRAADEPLVCPLCAHLRYRRDQQQLLSPAGGGNLPALARPGAAWIPLCRESEPLPDAHEEAEGARGSPCPLLRQRRQARADAWTCA